MKKFNISQVLACVAVLLILFTTFSLGRLYATIDAYTNLIQKEAISVNGNYTDNSVEININSGNTMQENKSDAIADAFKDIIVSVISSLISGTLSSVTITIALKKKNNCDKYTDTPEKEDKTETQMTQTEAVTEIDEETVTITETITETVTKKKRTIRKEKK
ncbi:MAG: hypothetical protein IKI97_00475 [Clostridia bacterium]|nr:hypothetical protein [Clostridia bacterium]MBR4049832.1 hypothetical protein [Clostridia bacterium]